MTAAALCRLDPAQCAGGAMLQHAGMPESSTIELRVEKIGQLFNTLDPLPFRERDLDHDTEEYIVDWARELPRAAPLRIIVHLPAAEADTEESQVLGTSIRSYFRYRAKLAANERKELFRIGRYSLAVGLAVLMACIAGGRFLLDRTGEAGRFLNEGLVILGWVANWRPIEIFLYDWWPISRRQALFVRLAEAEILLKRV